MKYLLSLLIFAFVVGCATPIEVHPGVAISKPTLWTSPNGYLSTFPLNTVSTNELESVLGPPESVHTRNDETQYVYVLARGEIGERRFVYIMIDNLVVDVRYYDTGPYNGGTAVVLQNR